jgi:hypothetical protein
MKQAHNIIAKTSLTVDQFIALQEQSRKRDKSMSAILRDSWLNSSDGKPAVTFPSRPNLGQFRAKFLPGRSARTQMRVRMNN